MVRIASIIDVRSGKRCVLLSAPIATKFRKRSEMTRCTKRRHQLTCFTAGNRYEPSNTGVCGPYKRKVLPAGAERQFDVSAGLSFCLAISFHALKVARTLHRVCLTYISLGPWTLIGLRLKRRSLV
jgi:hypothetical protein